MPKIGFEIEVGFDSGWNRNWTEGDQALETQHEKLVDALDDLEKAFNDAVADFLPQVTQLAEMLDQRLNSTQNEAWTNDLKEQVKPYREALGKMADSLK